MIKFYNRIKSLLREKKGVSMVEMVITIVLISLFAVGTCQILATTIHTYHDMRTLQESQEVSDTLLDKICGELEGAQASFTALNKEDREKGTLKITDSGTKVELRDRTGSQIVLETSGTGEEKLINIHYNENKAESENGKITGYQAVDWKFDKKAYMGFYVDKLTFDLPQGEYPKNVIHVVLVLKNKQNESFKTERYVECYNFKAEAGDFEKITQQ